MNPFIKIISGLIVFINRIIDSLDKRTIETIKQSFYLLVFICVIIGGIIGYRIGKQSAKKYGAPLAEHTDNVFDVIKKKERKNVSFNSMVEAKSIMEKEKSLSKKASPPPAITLNTNSEKALLNPILKQEGYPHCRVTRAGTE